MALRNWSTTAANNNSAAPDGFPEGMAPSGLNNGMREVMAQVRGWYETPGWTDLGHTPTRVDNDTFTVATDLTATYVAGRRLKFVGATTGYATIASSSYSAPDTTVNVTMDSGNIPTSLSTVALGFDISTGPILPYHRRTAAEISAGVTPTNFQYEAGDVRRYGASTAATASVNRLAIQQAFNANDYVRIPEAYTVNDTLTLTSNLVVDCLGGGSITFANGITDREVIKGTSLTNIEFRGLKVIGNGAAGFSNVLLITCDHVIFDHCSSTLSGAQGIQLEGCSTVTVISCELSENYFFGVFDRDGVSNRYIANRCFGNGDTGVASSSGGRGINLWRCVDCYVAGNRFVGNNEYGFRLYSEAADTGVNRGHRILGNYFEDNAAADLVLYDESEAGELIFQCVLSGNIIRRTTEPTLDCAVLVHGGDNIFSDTHVIKEGTFGDFVAFFLFHAIRTSFSDCTATNLRDCFTFSSSEDCVVDNFYGNTVATGFGSAGLSLDGNVVRNSRFVHGGGGSTDDCIVNYNATGRNYIEGNLIDGFRNGIYIGSEAVTLRDNKTINSSAVGMRKDNDAQVDQEIIGNVWDSTNPALIQQLERRTVGNAVLYASAAPTIRTWAVGDRCYNNAPSAGNPKSWVCTTAGTPGTWTSEGNL